MIKVPFLIINLIKLDLDKSKFLTRIEQTRIIELRVMQAQKIEDYGIKIPTLIATKHFATMYSSNTINIG